MVCIYVLCVFTMFVLCAEFGTFCWHIDDLSRCGIYNRSSCIVVFKI